MRLARSLALVFLSLLIVLILKGGEAGELTAGATRILAAGAIAAPHPQPTTNVLYTFDSPGGCIAQGWTTRDLTAQVGDYFHVENFSSMGAGYQSRLGVLQGTKSLWCGTRASGAEPYCSYAALPGYGNNWDQSFRTKNCVVTGPDAEVSFSAQWDTEPSYDAVTIEMTTDCDGKAGWTALDGGPGVWDGYSGGTFTTPIPGYLNANGTLPILVRIHFVSNSANSDEDGGYDGDGAVVIDNLALTSLPLEDFEGEALGATSSQDWISSPRPARGNFAGLFSGSTFASNPNLSCMWAFVNGSTEFYNCGVPPRPTVKIVPHIKDGQYMNNQIESPSIPITGAESGLLLRFDVYHELPLDNLVYYTWSARFKMAGCWSKWLHDGEGVYNGNEKTWVTRQFEFGHLSPVALSNVTEVQVALGVVDMCKSWCGIYGTGACHSFAPLFDNIAIIDTDVGTVTGKVYADVGNDCIFSVGADFPLSGRRIEASPGGWHTYTDATGNYTLAVPVGQYSIAQQAIPNDVYKVQPCQAASYAVNVTVGTVLSGKDFALYPIGRISGKVYADYGADCAFTAGPDFPLANRAITFSGGYTAFTDANGDYTIKVPVGNYTVTQAAIAGDPYTNGLCQPVSLTANVTANAVVSGKDFAMQGGPPRCDVTTYIVSNGFEQLPPPCSRMAINPCPGFEHEYLFVVKNRSTATLPLPTGATISMRLGAQFTIATVSSTLPISTVSSSGPNQRTVQINAPVNPGQTCVVTVRATPSSGGTYLTQMDLIDNALCFGQKIATHSARDECSCDPNDMAVAPAGCGPNGSILGDEPLTYTIRFENVGPGTAHNISIADVLDADVELSSVALLTSSDPVTGLQVEPGNVLVFDMQGIELPGTYDPANNKGYVVFSVDPKPGLAEGTTIENDAAITFDYNDPVITNTTLNTIRAIPSPTAAFVAVDTCAAGSPFVNFAFTGGPTDNATYLWNFGEGAEPATSTAQSPTGIQYSSDGEKVVVLTMTRFGCESAAIDTLTVGPCGTTASGAGPLVFSLSQNTPNPFNPSTRIPFVIEHAGHVTIKVYDIGGRFVRTLVDEQMRQGEHVVQWDGRNATGEPVASGMYFYRLIAGDRTLTRKAVLLK